MRLIKKEVIENIHGPWYPSYLMEYFDNGDIYCTSYGKRKFMGRVLPG